MIGPIDGYGQPGGSMLRRILVRSALLLVTVVAIGALAGWTEGLRASDDARPADASLVSRRLGTLSDQLEAARAEATLMQLELDRAREIIDNSTRYQIPADLAGDIYDIALSEGIDPALAFQLVKIESSFRSGARSSMDALGYTQIQLATARFYDRDVTEKELFERRTNLRLGFRFLKDLLVKFDNDTHLALLAYNRGPARVAEILASGGNPANGYSDAVLNGYQTRGTH